MNYRPEIDGLRALAVVPVILFHAGFEAFSGGFVGVDVFFVISGYLITSIILTQKAAGTFSLMNFYERRARRILPALFAVLVASTVAAWFLLLPNEMRRFSESLVSVSLFASNVFFYLTSGYFGSASETKPLLHTWSLSVEEQYYLLFPVIVLLTLRHSTKLLIGALVAVFLISLYISYWLADYDAKAGFLLSPARFWELLLGSFISIFGKQLASLASKPMLCQIGSLVGLLMILLSIFAFDRSTPFPSTYALLPALGTVLLIICSVPGTFCMWILRRKTMVFIGLISYSTYLWHQPLFAFARHRSIEEPSMLVFSALSIASFVFGYFSWRYVERPFRDQANFSRRQIFSLSALLGSIFCAFGLAGHYKEGFPGRMSYDVLNAHITREHEQLLKKSGCMLKAESFDLKACARGGRDSVPHIALVGDSHAQSLVHEMAGAFEKEGISFYPLVKSRCPFNLGYSPESADREAKQCAEYQGSIERLLKNEEITTYIVFTRADSPDRSHISQQGVQRFESHLKSIQTLAENGKRVILIYPIPSYSVHVSDYIAKSELFNSGVYEEIKVETNIFKHRIAYFYNEYDALELGQASKKIRTVGLFCDSFEEMACVTQRGKIPLYYDDDHLSNQGARLIVNELMEAIK
jgi:peptidoglycan/LPS O-acetylase OafA/YrhL